MFPDEKNPTKYLQCFGILCGKNNLFLKKFNDALVNTECVKSNPSIHDTSSSSQSDQFGACAKKTNLRVKRRDVLRNETVNSNVLHGLASYLLRLYDKNIPIAYRFVP